jgi:hypothetical protein
VRKDLNEESLRKVKLQLALKHDVSFETIDRVMSLLFKKIKSIMKDPEDFKDIRLFNFGTFSIKPICRNPGKVWGYQNYEQEHARAEANQAEYRRKYKERMAKYKTVEEDVNETNQ